MSKEVTVEVTVTERVTYSTRVKMPLDKFEALNKEWLEAVGRDRRHVEERIGEFCDRESDWQNADDLELDDFRVVNDDEA